jgi:hypothetical protein
MGCSACDDDDDVDRLLTGYGSGSQRSGVTK